MTGEPGGGCSVQSPRNRTLPNIDASCRRIVKVEEGVAVAGSVVRHGKQEAKTGRAWLDREWSSSYLPPDAVGWDWRGVNFDDGAALMAFPIRGRDGQALHAGGTLRRATRVVLAPEDVRFVPRRHWHSPERPTGPGVNGAPRAASPVPWRKLPEGVLRIGFDRVPDRLVHRHAAPGVTSSSVK